jgi:CRISPR-associated endonuclease/helicase Cas3
MQLNEYWAKTEPFQSIITHSRICGRVSQILFEEWLCEGTRTQLAQAIGLSLNQTKEFVGYLSSLHDVGKIEYSFQAQNECFRNKFRLERSDSDLFISGTRHEKTSRAFLRTLWKERGEDRVSGAVFSKVIGAHHQGKSGSGNFKRQSKWYCGQSELEALMQITFLGECEHSLPELDRVFQGKTGAILLGLLILSDWISSGAAFSDAEEWINSPDADAQITAKAFDFIFRSGLKPTQVKWPESFCGVWPIIPKDGRRKLQQDMERLFSTPGLKPSVVLIEAPMGEGKTEAGVFAALRMAKLWGKDGFYIAMPTAATANQMVGRMEALLSMHDVPKEVRLLHSMAWLESDLRPISSQDERTEIEKWLSPTKRGLLGQFSVGTVDQAMFAATNVRYGVLRLLGLSNKVLVIDEIHSYDAYMSEIIVRLLEWCKALEIPVVMLSATLPPAMKKKLLVPYGSQSFSEAYPLITSINADGTATEHVVSETSHKLAVSIRQSSVLRDTAAIARAAAEEVKDGGCLCVLMNTVREAQEVYKALQDSFDGDLLLFHAQFPAEQRTELEHACIRRYGKDKTHRPQRSILVATQVVEQSLDVDFDAMYTAVAPIDLLIQRVGRVFRHEHTVRPSAHAQACVTVLAPGKENDFGSSAVVYPECLLKSAIRCISKHSAIRIPEDIPELVKAGYDPANVPEEEAKQWMENQIREQVEAGASQQYLISPPDKMFSALENVLDYEDGEDAYALSAKTRLSEPTVKIALLSEDQLTEHNVVIREKNGMRVAEANGQKAAKWVMKNSLSVSVRRLGQNESDNLYIKGDKLITGVRIYLSENEVCRLGNGKILRVDPQLGLLIEDGEK